MNWVRSHGRGGRNPIRPDGMLLSEWSQVGRRCTFSQVKWTASIGYLLPLFHPLLHHLFLHQHFVWEWDCVEESNDGDGKFCFWRQHKFFKRLTQQNDHECVTSASARGIRSAPQFILVSCPIASSLSSCDRTNRQEQTALSGGREKEAAAHSLIPCQISRGKHVHCLLPLSVSLFARLPGHFHWTRPHGCPPLPFGLYLSAYWRFEVCRSRTIFSPRMGERVVLTVLFVRVSKINFQRFPLAWNCLT